MKKKIKVSLSPYVLRIFEKKGGYTYKPPGRNVIGMVNHEHIYF